MREIFDILAQGGSMPSQVPGDCVCVFPDGPGARDMMGVGGLDTPSGTTGALSTLFGVHVLLNRDLRLVMGLETVTIEALGLVYIEELCEDGVLAVGPLPILPM